MKVLADKRLFWFLKEGSLLDLSKPQVLDTYVQQIISRGGAGDIKTLFENITLEQFKQAFFRIENFLPVEVRKFWRDFFGNN